MSPEQREKLKELHAAAIELPVAERSSFLDAECKGDAELRAELDSLLAHAEPVLPVLLDERPVWAKLALEVGPRRDLTGIDLSHYKIQSLIGVGGMGDVWLAKDQHLGRKVAIKILPTEFSADTERVRRFEREARAASALNHPNIITVHEIGLLDDLHFIVTEFVDGETLRQRLKAGPLVLAEALEIARQVSEALAAAHEIGIVHRDIKPENIMLRRDGYVKVLDFGIAKWIERRHHNAGPPETERRAIAQPLRLGETTVTQQGKTPGTLGYMSPEQAAGLPVDARTDLFSLGVVLHEMIAGQAPFDGATSLEAVQAILECEPPPLPLEVPAALTRIARRALCKNRDERYQTAAELLDELKALAQEIEAKAISLPQGVAAKAEHAQPQHLPSSQTRRQALTTKLALAALVVALLIVVVFGWKLTQEQDGSLTKTAEVVQFTHLGKVTNTAISRDGKYVVYTMSEAGRQSIWLRETGSTEQRLLIPPVANDEYYGLTFSPDGQNIFYLRYEETSDTKRLCQVSILGGDPKKVMDGVDNAIAFAPDGQRFAFIRHSLDKKESYLIVVNVDGSGERLLLKHKEPLKFSFGWQWPLYSWNGRVAWSPDGKRIAFAVGTDGAETDHQLFVIAAEGGPEQLLTTQKWWRILGIDWVRNGNDVLVLAAEQQLGPFRVWRLALPGAKARQLVHDPNSYWCLSATADGRVIVSIQADQRTTLWRASTADLNDYTIIPSGKTDGRLGLRWTPDNKLLFDSSANGSREIWDMDADGTNRNRLTSGAAADERAESSSDGRFIIYVSRQQANDVPHIWLLDRSGGNRKQLTNGSGEYEAHFSPDGRWIIYVSKNTNGKAAVWKMPTGGGPAVQITTEQIEELSPAISPDGQLLAYYKGLGLQSKRIEVLNWGGLRLKQSFEVRRTAYLLRWTPDGRALTYADTDNEVTNLWKAALSGGEPKQITFFKTDKIGRFDWSRDGKYLICSRHAWQRDVFLIKDFK